MKHRRFGRNNGFVVLFFMIALLVTVTVVIAVRMRVDKVEVNMRGDSVIKTLFVMEGEDEVLFTDLFIFYPQSRKGALINIRGDIGAIFKSLGRVDRIDTIYKEKGIDVYKSEIENLVGQSIPFYVVLKMKNFGELTDMLSGLDVFIPTPVDVQLDGHDERWLLPNGNVTLDGEKIRTYLTYRQSSDESEVDINERRQKVMVALLTAIGKKSSMLADKKSFELVSQRMESNLELNDFYNYISVISTLDSEKLKPQSILGSARTIGNQTLWFPLYDGQIVKDIVNQAANRLISLEGAGENRVYALNVLNGTSNQGLASRTATLFRSAGYDIVNTKNARKSSSEDSEYENTLIIDHIGDAEAAKNLGDFINCKNIVDENDEQAFDYVSNDSTVDFTVILGKDFTGRIVR
ncbi:LCP family protein [Treponema zioleckii]|uniref:LCP family protein n=1 Tax=Treponema zioleckii TaxID=331680 RepID=UPI00168BF4BB|nr:LCP family protein [Treponema zioleckii]